MLTLRSSNESAVLTAGAKAARPLALALAWAAVALLAALLLSGCTGSRGGTIPYNVEGFAAPDPPSALVGITEDYRIAPMDSLRVTVFQVEDLSGEYEVDLGGDISMPLIGRVRAADLTTAELQTRLAQLYAQRYLRNPSITVQIRTSSRRSITVDGAVNQPGQYPVAGPTTLKQAVAMARGTNSEANPRRVAVFRQIQGQRMAAAFDLTRIRRGRAEDPVIFTGDIFVVDGSNLRAIQREILTTLPLLGLFRPF